MKMILGTLLYLMLQQCVKANVEGSNHAENQPHVSIAVLHPLLTPTSQLGKQGESFAKQLQTDPMAQGGHQGGLNLGSSLATGSRVSGHD